MKLKESLEMPRVFLQLSFMEIQTRYSKQVLNMDFLFNGLAIIKNNHVSNKLAIDS